MKHVIIGAGAAGLTAAKTIRRLRPEDEILVLSSDTAVHSRCMLHYYIAGMRDEAALSFVEPDFFTKFNIQWLSGVRVLSINPEESTIQLENQTISYDKLLIATGASSIIPPVGALATAGNVFPMRHLEDAKKISQHLSGVKNAVVVGAGLVGMDAAYALLHKSKNVTVVEMASQILPLNLDAHASATYQSIFEGEGCQFRLSTKVTGTDTDEAGNVTHIVLESGEKIPCDMVVLATGVRPATGIVADTNIACKRGITVNECLQTNYSNIYAAGDVTAIAEIWPCATKQGEVAAQNMCGEMVSFNDVFSYRNTINFFGLTTLSLGDSTFKDGGTALVREDKHNYIKYVTHDNIVTGLVMQGDISYSGVWQYLIKNKVDISQIEKPVWKLSYADFYATDEKGRYSWN